MIRTLARNAISFSFALVALCGCQTNSSSSAQPENQAATAPPTAPAAVAKEVENGRAVVEKTISGYVVGQTALAQFEGDAGVQRVEKTIPKQGDPIYAGTANHVALPPMVNYETPESSPWKIYETSFHVEYENYASIETLKFTVGDRSKPLFGLMFVNEVLTEVKPLAH